MPIPLIVYIALANSYLSGNYLYPYIVSKSCISHQCSTCDLLINKRCFINTIDNKYKVIGAEK